MSIFLSSGSIDITSQTPVPLSGFAERRGVFTEVLDALEINFVALKQEEKLVLIYSVDTLFVPEDFVTAVLEKFGAVYELLEENIWMAATHTHYAPSLDKEKPVLGVFDDEYYQLVKARLLLLTAQVLESTFKPVRLEYGKGKSVLNVNRRKKLLRPKPGFGVYNKVLMYPDYNGWRDDDIHLLRWVYEDGSTATVLWNYACHPVSYPHLHRVTAEYVGYARKQFRDLYKNEKLPVAFLIGFAGNLKPDLTAVTNSRWRDKLNYFFQLGPKFVRFPSTAMYSEWTAKLWDEIHTVVKTLRPYDTAVLKTVQYDLPLSKLIGDSKHTVHFKRLQLAEGLQLTGVSAEVLAEYSELVKEVTPKVTSVNVGCLAGTRIYLPTDKQVQEGGYEVHGFLHNFGIAGTFKKDLLHTVKTALEQLWTKS